MTSETLAFLFTDIEGSTALLTRLGDEAYSTVREDHHRIVRSSLQRFGGVEQGTQGDSFLAVFRSPSSCVKVVFEIQRVLRRRNRPGDEQLRIRMGIHTGEASGASNGMVGYQVPRAARIATIGHGGGPHFFVNRGTRRGLAVDGRHLGEAGNTPAEGLRAPEVIFQLSAYADRGKEPNR